MSPAARPGAAAALAAGERRDEGAAATAIAVVRSAAAYVGISLYVLLVAPPAMALAILFRWKSLLYVLGHLGVALALRLAGITPRVVGRARVPASRPVVFCANHQSNVDPPLLYRVLHPRLHILYKAELSRLPLLGRAMRVGGFVPVERRNREQAFASIREGAASIRAGNSFLIFPEGTRSRTSDLLPFKKGGFIMAIEAQAPIVPVAVMGGRDAMRKGSPIVRPVTVSVRIGDPVETAGMTVEDRDRLIEIVRGRIGEMLARGPIAAGEA